MRQGLLWLSERQGIFNFVRRNGVARKFASRFVAGETIDTGVQAAVDLAAKGITSSLDLLGESLRHLYHNRVRTALTPLRTRAEVRATHLAIADAIIEGRADEAERLMREHMEAVAKGTRSLRSILDEGIEWT